MARSLRIRFGVECPGPMDEVEGLRELCRIAGKAQEAVAPPLISD